MEKRKKFLAKLGRPEIVIEDHGQLTIFLSASLEDGGTYGTICGLSFGNDDWKKQTSGKNWLGTYLTGLMQAVGVRELDAIEGKYVYLLTEKGDLGFGSSSSDICAIEGLKGNNGCLFDFEEWRALLK